MNVSSREAILPFHFCNPSHWVKLLKKRIQVKSFSLRGDPSLERFCKPGGAYSNSLLFPLCKMAEKSGNVPIHHKHIYENFPMRYFSDHSSFLIKKCELILPKITQNLKISLKKLSYQMGL